MLTVEPPEEVARPTLMGYTIKELRRAIDELSLEQPPAKASKVEIVRPWTSFRMQNSEML